MSQAKLTAIVGTPPGGLDSAPAVCSWGPGRLDVFAKGTDGALWHAWWNGAWHGWESLGAPSLGLESAPTAASWGAGRIDVFVRADGGALWHKWFDNGWHDWEGLGAPAGRTIYVYTAPAACSWGANRLDIFVSGSDGQIWQKWFYNGWQAWVPLGRPSTGLGGSPGALSTVSWGYPRVDVFIRGGEGGLYQPWWNGAWQDWKVDTGGVLLAQNPYAASGGNTAFGNDWYAPAVCSWGANRLDVFFVDTNGYLRQKYFDNGWKPVIYLGGEFLSASPNAVAWQLGTTTRIDIFSRGSAFALLQTYWAGGWHGWYNLGPS